MKSLILIPLLLSFNVQALEYSVQLIIGSNHYGSDYSYNENNTGLAIKAKDYETVYKFGGYKNSYYNSSVFATIGKEYKILNTVYIGYDLGLVSGYYYPITPFARLTSSIHILDKTYINIGFVPSANVATFSYEFKF